MKRLRISINGLLGLVLLVAVDCVTVRLLRVRPEWGLLAFFIFPQVASSIFCLPMANLASLGGSRILVRRGSSRGFWIGATIFAVLSELPLFVWQGPGFSWFESKLNLTGSYQEMTQTQLLLLYLSIAILAIVPIQLILVLGGGLLGRTIGRRDSRNSTEARPGRWLRLVSSLVFVILATIPAIGAECFRRIMDPEMPRLAAGSKAVVALSPDSNQVLENGQTWFPEGGSGVRILNDDQGYLPGMRWNTSGYFEDLIDARAVRVEFLDGPFPNRTGDLPRWCLRPSP